MVSIHPFRYCCNAYQIFKLKDSLERNKNTVKVEQSSQCGNVLGYAPIFAGAEAKYVLLIFLRNLY